MGSTPIGISGSRAAAVLGLSKYQTQVAIWQQICEARRPGFNAERGYILEPFEGNASTRFGLAFEGAIISLTEQQTGETITDQEGEYYLDGEVPITCHIDGRFSPDKIFEGKTVYSRGFDMNWGEPGTDRIPQEYAVQTQHNMMLTGAEECHVSALIFPKSPEEWEEEGWKAIHNKENGGYYILERSHGEELFEMRNPAEWARTLRDMGYFKTYIVKANPAIHEMLKETYLSFWQKYVLTEQPPEIDDYEDIRRLFPAPVGTLVVSDQIASQFKEYASINKEIGKSGHLSKRKDQLKTEILKVCLDKTTVADDESIEKVVFRDSAGNKCGQFDGKTFRA